jgi:hypothetical protein
MFHNSPYCFHVSCSAKDFEGSSAPCVDCVQPIGRRTPVSTISTPTPCYSHWAVPWQDADGWSDLLSSTLTCQFSLLLCCFVRCISLHIVAFNVAATGLAELNKDRQVLLQCAMDLTSHWTKERKHSSAPSTLGNVRSLERFASSMFKARKNEGLSKNGVYPCIPQNGNFNGKNMGKWW